MRKGIILAGGKATRLFPATLSVSKQILPIYDKPMIYYPLSVLLLSDIRDIMIISTQRDIKLYEDLLGNGSQIGVNISYEIQDEPNGIAESFLIAETFIGNDSVALVLGDNIFYGQRFSEMLERANRRNNGATIFAYYVVDPSSFGVIDFDENGKVLSIEEKPKNPKSNYVIPGLYFYDNRIVEIAKSLKPSKRGELEISDINTIYLNTNNLNVEVFGRGMAWLDTGTHDGLLEASNFVSVLQKRQGLYVACIEEIAFRKGYITKKQLDELASRYSKTSYGKYLMNLE